MGHPALSPFLQPTPIFPLDRQVLSMALLAVGKLKLLPSVLEVCIVGVDVPKLDIGQVDASEPSS